MPFIYSEEERKKEKMKKYGEKHGIEAILTLCIPCRVVGDSTKDKSDEYVK
jgi:hypothetical protein